MSDKKYPCGLIRDLLPLYRDNVCGEESRRIVEEHLAGCGACKRLSEQIADGRVESLLMREADGVLEHHRKRERRVAVTAGMITAGILMIPVIVCFICNLATGHALDWFFIVLTALFVVASLTVVPMLANRYRLSKTVASFTGSLLVLLLTCCIYTRGRWFLLAAVPVIFGLSVIFLPFILMQLPLPGPLCRHKGLTAMLWDTLWLYGIIVVCGLYAGGVYYWHNALLITSWCLLFPWLIFLTVRYVKCHPATKTGILIMITGCFTSTVNDVIACVLLPKESVHAPSVLRGGNLMDWTNPQQVGDNACLLTLIGSLAVGAACIAAGIVRSRKRNKRNEQRTKDHDG